jgi:chloride channel protein, CIC family
MLPTDAASSAGGAPRPDRLRDFTADGRLLTLTAFAVVIGAISAVVAYALAWLIGGITNLVYYHRLSSALVSPEYNLLGWWAVPIPVVGGLIVGLMARYGSEKIRGHGIPEAMESILVGESRMEPRVAILKPLGSAIAIGTGGPFGAEGPIIVTGGAFGSLFAQAFHVSSAERKTLLVAGAAGGMAAIFGTPVAAVLIGVELLLFEWKPRSLIPVAASAAVAGMLRVPFFGPGPLFPVTVHGQLGWPILAGSLLAGLAAGAAATVVTWMVYGFEDLFRKLPVHWMWWPAIGALVVGLGGLVAPRALGVGYDTIGDLLRGHLVVSVLVGLLIAKALIWSVALSSGTSGGVLAPLLIIGGSLGALGAHVLHAPDPGLWALVTMAAVMGATMNAPLTAIVFVLELTLDVGALPALLVACIAADAVTVLALRRSIMTEKVARHGHHVTREYIVSPLQRLLVSQVMDANPPTLPASSTVGELSLRLAGRDPLIVRHNAWLLVDGGGRLTGILTRGDLLRALQSSGGDARPLGDFGTAAPEVTYPDELLQQAVEKMAARGVGRLPVVARDDPTKLAGYLGRTGLIDAWIRRIEEEEVRETGVVREDLRLWWRRLRGVWAGSRLKAARPGGPAGV